MQIANQDIMVGTAIGSGILVTGYIGYNYYRQMQYYPIIDAKRKEIEKKKAELYQKLVDEKKPLENMEKITTLKLKDLLAGLDAGAYKPIDVLKAYQAKALQMDKKYNFIVDINPYAETDVVNCVSSKRPNLRGVPVSIKDCFSIKGCDCTLGIPSFANHPAENDSILIHTLRLQGAIPFLVTSMCQTGLSIENSSPLFGETKNPFDPTRTCGGSSGGEAAILASGGSILGMGSDIGGDIRIPAHYCGVYGLKPTSIRFSRRFIKVKHRNQKIVLPSYGPMARTIDDLVDFFKAIACGDLYHLDPQCPPLCFNEKIFEKKRPLRIGYYYHIGGSQVEPTPSVKRAVKLAIQALTTVGHTLEEFHIPEIDYAIYDLYMGVMFSDGGSAIMNEMIGYNPVDRSIKSTINGLKMPNVAKTLMGNLLKPFNYHDGVILTRMAGSGSVYNFNVLQRKVDKYKDEVLQKWHSQKLDGLICPVLPIVAPPLGTSHKIMSIVSYTTIFNLLDYPAGSVPITKVTSEDISELLGSYPKKDKVHKLIKTYQRETVNLPVGVQCVSLMWREETCLRIMRDIANNLNK